MRRILISMVWMAAIAVSVAAHGSQNYGKPGEAIHLAVGYQPYFTPTWSGAVVRARRFYERYLPPGSSVEFQIGIKGGGVITAALQTGRESIGYLGTTPTVAVSTTAATDGTKIRIVATTSLGQDLCNILLVRHDAPAFAAPQDALKWLGQRPFAVPYHTCAHAFALQLLNHSARPRVIIDATPDLIMRAFSTGHVDAAVVWEPFASQLVEAGLARRAASGATIGAMSGAFIVVRDDLLNQRPDIVKAWLQAEFDAQRFMADPGNRQIVVRAIHDQTSGLSPTAIESALYEAYPRAPGRLQQRMKLPFEVTPAAIDMLNQTAAVLALDGASSVTTIPADAIRSDLAREIVRERGLPP